MKKSTVSKNLALSFIKKNSLDTFNATFIARTMKEKLGLSHAVKTIQKYASAALKDIEKAKSIEQDLFKKDYGGYEADSESYYFTKNNKVTTLPIDVVGKILCGYAQEGLNLTKTQVAKTSKVSPEVITLVLNKLKFTKDSEIRLEAILDQYDERFHGEFIKTCMNNMLDGTPGYDDPVQEAVFDTYKKSAFNFKYMQRDLAIMMKEVGEHQFNAVQFNPSPSHISKEMTVFITDPHIGCKEDNYDVATVIKQLQTVSDKIRNYPNCKVNVVFLGDLFHSIVGTKHPDTWKSIEPGICGAQALITVSETIIGFLAAIINLNAVYIVGGNHDTLAPSLKDEPDSEGAKLLAYMISKALEPFRIPVIYDYHMISFSQENIQIIGIHGDTGIGKLPATELAWKYGDNSKYNLIMCGHVHSRTIARKDDNSRCRKMSVPAFAPQDAYAKRNGYDSLSGYMLVFGSDLPEIIDVPLKY